MRTNDEGYAREDKLDFLQACAREEVAVSPWLRTPKLVVKHRNEEGGLGMHTFVNADAGGDYIIQAWLHNSPEVARLLPTKAPLSTLRFVTASRACTRARPREECAEEDILVLSACFRAGREGASTDHSCIMYDVDLASNRLRLGTSNSHWYQLGLVKACGCPWFSPGHTLATHPDTGAAVADEALPSLPECVELVTRAHRKLMPGVPLVGWDVAMTEPEGTATLSRTVTARRLGRREDRARASDCSTRTLTEP